MFRRRPVPTPPPISATYLNEGRAGISCAWRAQAALASIPEKFNRFANGPEGPFVVFEADHLDADNRGVSQLRTRGDSPASPSWHIIGNSHR